MHQNCGLCSAQIPADSSGLNLVVCADCGWTPPNQTHIEKQTQKTTIMVFSGFAVAACVLFFHAATWDQHFVSIVPIKIMKALGVASAQQLNSMAEICEDRMLPNCQEEALQDLVKKEPSNLAALEELARLKTLLKKNSEALALYQSFFAKGGKSSEAAYKLAKLLEDKSDYGSAERFYLQALAAKPDVLQITVNEAYVKMLIRNGQYKKARKHIDELRDNGAPKYFLSTEYTEIEKNLRKRS